MNIFVDPCNTLEKYYKSPIHSDVTLIANDNPNGIPCHKLILIMRSEYFEKLFDGDFIERSKREIVLETFSYYWLEKFIKCIYTGKLVFEYDKFEEMLTYGSYLQIHKFNESFDDMNHLYELLKIYDHNTMIELSYIHGLSNYYSSLFYTILTMYGKDILCALSMNIFKDMLPLIQPIDYTHELKEKCENQLYELKNYTVINGKCFGNVPIICNMEIVKDMQVKLCLYRLDSMNKLLDTTYDYLITAAIIRNGITTVIVNFKDYNDPLLREAVHYILSYSDYDKMRCEIFSPNENVYVLVGYSNNHEGIYKEEYGDEYRIMHMRVYSNNKLQPSLPIRNFPRSSAAFSLSNIYLISLRKTYNGYIQYYIEYSIIDITSSNIVKTSYISYTINATDNNSDNYHAHDSCYNNGLLYVVIALSSNNNSNIVIINPEIKQIMWSISRSGFYSLMSFGGIVYGYTMSNVGDSYSLKLYEIRDNKLVYLEVSRSILVKYKKFLITGSYSSDGITRIIQ